MQTIFRQMQNLVVPLLFVALLSSCGYKLRGVGDDSLVTTPIELSGLIEGSPFYRVLSSQFGGETKGADRLEINGYQINHRQLSLSAVAGPQLYSSKLTFSANLYRSSGEPIQLSQPYVVEREYSFDSTNPVGLNDYQRQISEQLMAEAARTLQRQTSRLMKKVNHE